MTPMSTRSTEARQRSRTSGGKTSASMWLRSMRHLVNALFAFAPIGNTIGRTVKSHKSYLLASLGSASDIGVSKADFGLNNNAPSHMVGLRTMQKRRKACTIIRQSSSVTARQFSHRQTRLMFRRMLWVACPEAYRQSSTSHFAAARRLKKG
jgi:hypothetical protein